MDKIDSIDCAEQGQLMQFISDRIQQLGVAMKVFLISTQYVKDNVPTVMANTKEFIQDLDYHSTILFNQDADRFAKFCKGYMEA
ncbi:MAG: hypothetical protein ACJA2E_000495 [Arenicella sp.]